MTEVEKKGKPVLSSATTTTALTSLIDDEAYLMTMVDGDSLLPGNVTFASLFEGENGLNPDELTDIAGLLAPEVSDDDASGGSVSPETVVVTPENVRTTMPSVTTSSGAAEKGEVPVLPMLTKHQKKTGAVVVSPTGGQKRSTVDQDVIAEAPPPPEKKAKVGRITLKPKSTALKKQPASVPTLLDAAAPNPLFKNKLPTLAPKPEALTSKKLIASAPSSSSAAKSAFAQAKKTHTTPAVTAKATTTPETIEPATVTSAPSSTTTDKATHNTTKKPLTEEERAQQCRDRNRQHARNTRLRKKAFVEDLKRQLRELVEKRDADLAEDAKKAKIVEQQREVRFQVMQDFLQLRGRNETNPRRWGAILEDGFELRMPRTNFQAMVDVPSNTDPGATVQVLCGVTNVMADSSYFASFLQTFGNTTTATHPTHGDDANIPVTFLHHCDRSNFFMDGCNASLSWTANSVGAVQKGAPRELELWGSMRARFCCQTNRLEQAEIQFDTGVVQSQMNL